MLVAKTVEIPASEIARMAAQTGEVPWPPTDTSGKKAASFEREVVVKVAREGVSSGRPVGPRRLACRRGSARRVGVRPEGVALIGTA